jgi:hypothetical protein
MRRAGHVACVAKARERRPVYEEILKQVDHRPWTLPRAPWIGFQSWQQELFAHWPVDAEAVRSALPPGLELDTFDGQAWVGATPFIIRRSHVRGLPPLPPIAEYLELNLRTYVRRGGMAGVWFFSLEASSRTAVLGGRALYRLPYFVARMRMSEAGSGKGGIEFESRRPDGRAAFLARYAPAGPPTLATPGSLDHFLFERYMLYAGLHRGGLLRAHVHHPPWRLQPAEAEVDAEGLLRAADVVADLQPALLHYIERQDTLIWGPERV